MDMVGALRDMFVSAVPTFILVWILYAYVAKVFYAPMRKALDERHAATAGLRQRADEQIALAERKTSEYEDALRSSRAELYKHQEEERSAAMTRRAAILQTAREAAQAKTQAARLEIEKEAATARQSLASQSEEMAAWIAQAVLNPSAQRSGGHRA